MKFASTWIPILQAPSCQKVQLLSISPSGQDPGDDRYPIALQPGCLRASTHRYTDVPTADGRIIPFWPTLQAWAPVTWQLSLSQRRAEISDTPIGVLPDAGLEPVLKAAGGGLFATAELALWSPGLRFEDRIVLAAGRIRNLVMPRANGPVNFSLTDGDPTRTVTYPPANFSKLWFPDLPEWVADQTPITLIIGPAPDRVVCVPLEVDANGLCSRWFYSASVERLPTAVQLNGDDLPATRWRAQILMPRPKTPTATFPVPDWCEITLATAVSAASDEISATGGVGITQTNPILFLLRVAGYPTTPEADAQLKNINALDFSVLINQSGDVLDIIRQQLLPQTDLVSTFRRGRFHVIKLGGLPPQWPLGLGQGLLFRLADQPAPLDDRSIANVIEVDCGRDHFASTTDPASLKRIVRDPDHGPPAIRQLLARSQSLYGVRPMVNEKGEPKPYPALDLTVIRDPVSGVVIACEAGERLADFLVLSSVFEPKIHAYQATWYEGMVPDLGWEVPLSDAREGLQAKTTRIVSMTFAANGPIHVYQEMPEV